VLDADKDRSDPQAADFRSGLCAALGQIPWKTCHPRNRRRCVTTMIALYRESPDGGTHSAAYYALNRWGQQAAIPSLPETPMPWADRGWAVNSLGITMVHIPAGTFWMGDESVISEPYEQPRHQGHVGRRFLHGPIGRSPSGSSDNSSTKWAAIRDARPRRKS
jgi:hypothetical protein